MWRELWFVKDPDPFYYAERPSETLDNPISTEEIGWKTIPTTPSQQILRSPFLSAGEAGKSLSMCSMSTQIDGQ